MAAFLPSRSLPIPKSRSSRNPPRCTAAPPKAAPLFIRAARGEKVPRPPVWLMRQAGRYMADFRQYSDNYPFRHRSETPDIATELSLQPWRSFKTDAIIMFSDILTPLPAMGVSFDVVKGTGPIIDKPIRTILDATGVATNFDTSHLHFVRDVLQRLRGEADNETALLGFVGAPFTLAAYMIEGKAQKNLLNVKKFMYTDSDSAAALQALLTRISEAIATYAIYQIDSGAQAVQLFDSWAHHLSPRQYAEYAIPYAKRVIEKVKAARPEVPIIFFANGSAGKLAEIRQIAAIADVIGVDWGVDIAEARRELGDVVLQGNVDPAILAVGSDDAIRAAVLETVDKAGGNLILNLGHGVVQQTPERAVGVFVDAARKIGA